MNEDAIIDVVKAVTNIFTEANCTIIDQLTILQAIKLTLDTSIIQQVLNERSQPSYIR
jgi:hypothetical protein